MKKKSFITHFITLSLGTIINVIIGFITIPIITRLVDPSDYGTLSIFTLYADFCVLIFTLGLDQAYVRFYYSKEDDNYKSALLHKCFRIPSIAWLIFSAGFLVIYGYVKFDFKFDFLISVFLCGYVLTQILNRFSMLTIRLNYGTKKYSFLNILNKSLYVGLSILLLVSIHNHDLMMLVIATFAGALAATVLGIIFERKTWFGKKDSTSISFKELIRYGLPFVLSMGITTLFQGIDKLSIEYFCSDYDVGIYASALNIVHIFTIVQTTFTALWTPYALEHYEKNPDDKELFKNVYSYMCAIMFAMGITIIVFKDLFVYILGEDYRTAAFVFPCLVFNPIMYTISETTVIGIDFSKKSYLHIIVAAIACIVNFAGNMILVPKFGSQGAAISTGFSYIVFFAFRTLFAEKSLKVGYTYWRLSIVTVLVFGYALLNTFYKVLWVSILGYFICLAIICIFYYKEIIYLIHYGGSFVKRIINKKGEAESE